MSPNLLVDHEGNPVERCWDPSGKYAEGFMHANRFWTMEISWRQHTLGCFILFCRRKDVRLMSDLTDEELLGLRQAMKAVQIAFRDEPESCPTHFNYLQMGNALPNLHLHGIPRYAAPVTFGGREWVDRSPGNPPIWANEEVPVEMVRLLRDKLAPGVQLYFVMEPAIRLGLVTVR